MANITQYNAPNTDIPQPTDAAASTAREAGMVENRFGREAGEAVGGAISRVGSQIGDAIDQHNDAMQFGQFSETAATLLNNLQGNWRDITSKTPDMGNTTILPGFQEKVANPAFDKLTDAVSNLSPRLQERAMGMINNARQELHRVTTADMMIRSADAVSQIENTVRTGSSQYAADNPGPSSLEFATQNYADSMRTQGELHGLDADAMARLDEHIKNGQKEIAVSGIQSLINKNAAAAAQDLNNGIYDNFIDGTTKDVMLNKAREAQHYQLEDQNAAYIQQKRIDDQAAQTAYGEAIQSINSGKQVANKYNQDPRLAKYGSLNKEIAEYQISHFKQVSEGVENMPHPAMRAKLQDQIYDKAINDPDNVDAVKNDILAAHKAGKISNAEQAQLWNETTAAGDHLNQHIHTVVGSISSNFMKSIQLNASLQTPEGMDAFQTGRLSYERYVQDEFHKAIAKGQSVTPLFDAANPNSPFNPAVARSYLFPQSAKQTIAQQADKLRNPSAQSYQVGQVQQFKQGSYKFKGGDPTKMDSWEQVK